MMLYIVTELQHRNFLAQFDSMSKLLHQIGRNKMKTLFLTAEQLEKIAEKFPHNNTLALQIKNAEIMAAIDLKIFLDGVAFEHFLIDLKKEKEEEIQLIKKASHAYNDFLESIIRMNNILTAEEIRKFGELLILIAKAIEDSKIKIKILDEEIESLDLIIEKDKQNVHQEKLSLIETIKKIYASDEMDFSFTIPLTDGGDSIKKSSVSEKEKPPTFILSLNKIKEHMRAEMQKIQNANEINRSTFDVFEEQLIKKGIEKQLMEHYHHLPPFKRDQLVKMNMDSSHCVDLANNVKTKIYSNSNNFSLYQDKNKIIDYLSEKYTAINRKIDLRNALYQIKQSMESGILHAQSMMKISQTINNHIPNMALEIAKSSLEALKNHNIFRSPQGSQQNSDKNDHASEKSVKPSENDSQQNNNPNDDPPAYSP